MDISLLVSRTLCIVTVDLVEIYMIKAALGLTSSEFVSCRVSLREVYLDTASNFYFWKDLRGKSRRRHLQKINFKHQYRLHSRTVLTRHFSLNSIKFKQLRLPL